MFHELSREDRMRLMRFVCSFAWADLEVQQEEREFVARLVRRLQLNGDERAKVERWLQVPPRPEEVDPTDVPREHRELFLEAARGVIAADNIVDQGELEQLDLFKRLLA